MTAQIPDALWIDGDRFDLCEIRGEGIFNPADHGIITGAPDTANWRGFICGYSVTDGQLVLDDLDLWSEPSNWDHTRRQIAQVLGSGVSFDDDLHRVGAMHLAHPVPFTGCLVVGRDFLEGLYVHMGVQEAQSYRHVLELTFDNGRLLSSSDRSREMAKIRRGENGLLE